MKKKLLSGLTELFAEKPDSFKGLYNGLDRIFSGDTKKNFKALNEFYQRISYIHEYAHLTGMMEKMCPSGQPAPKKLAKLGKIVRRAIENAGITHSAKDDVIVLDNNTTMHYQAWNGEELYPDNRVKIVVPAWYSGGRLIEQGYCESAE